VPARPLPVPDEQSAPFWAAAADHILMVAQCSGCSVLSLPPTATCGHCGSADPAFSFVPVSGTGAVRSWTVVRQAFLPGFDDDLPFLLVDVELDAQADFRLIGRLLDGVEPSPTLGEPVEIAWEDLAPDIAIPAFRRVP
jgi:uncharacterized OB-fold protein